MVAASMPVMVGGMRWGVLGFEGVVAELLPAVGAGVEVGLVVEVVAEEDVHDGEGERGVGAGVDAEVLVGEGGGAGFVGVDDDEASRRCGGLLR